MTFRPAWPYHGRDADEDVALKGLNDGRAVVLTGPAGIGKTTTAKAVVNRLTSDGIKIRWITASPAARPIPLSCIAPLVLGMTSGDLVGVAATTLGPSSAAGADRQPVLVVDDAHHLDEASSVVVHQLALSTPVRLMMTLRPHAASPSAVSRLLAESTTVFVNIQPMSTSAITAIVSAALGGPLDAASTARLTRTADGNPLYVRELIEGSLASGALQRSGVVWRFVGTPSATPLLEELVLVRLQPLDAELREAVELIALCGRLELDLARALVDDAALERLERSGILVVVEDDGAHVVDLIHPLYRELTRNQLGQLTRKRLYRRLAEAADTLASATPADSLRTAVWHLRAGTGCDPVLLEHAARRAMEVADAELAAELALAAFAIRPSTESGLVAARSLSETGRHDRAEVVLREAQNAVPDVAARAAFSLRLAEERWWWAHDLHDARTILNEARPGVEPWDTVLDAQDAVFDLLEGNVARALQSVEPLWPDPEEPVRFIAGIALAQGLAYVDRAVEAFEIARDCFERATGHERELLGDPYVHVFGQVLALIHAGRLDDARAAGELVHRLAAEQSSLVAQAWGATMHGFAMLFGARPAAAREAFAEALELWLAARCSGLARWSASGHALSCAATDHLDEAEASLERADHLDGRGFGLYDPFLSLGWAWIANARSDHRTARERGGHALTTALRSGAVVHAGVVAHDLARLGYHDLAQTAAADVKHLLRRSPGPYLDARLRYVEAAATGDGPRLEAAGAKLESLGADLFAAEAFTLAAQARRRHGAMQDARRDLGRASRALHDAGGATTPPLAASRRTGVLSPREAEVAFLAATGASNRAIADRLVIGERTVETHVAHAFTKLGISRREQLSAALAGIHP